MYFYTRQLIMLKRISTFILLVNIVIFVQAQNLPLGTWRSFMPLSNVVSFTQSTQNIYAATEYGVFSVDVDNHLIETYTKSDGLSEVETQKIAYNKEYSVLIIVYKNANIDLIQNGKITNLPYLKNANIISSKTVRNIATKDSLAYFAVGFGVVVVDLIKKEIKETYNFFDGSNPLACNFIALDNSKIYVATENGIFQTELNNPLILNFSTWQKISDGNTGGNISAIAKFDNKIWVAKDHQIYNYDNTNWALVFNELNWKTIDLSVDNNHLYLVQHKTDNSSQRIGKWENNTFSFLAPNSNIRFPLEVLEDKNGNIWHADLYDGLIKDTPNAQRFIPNGPSAITNKDMNFIGNTLYVASSNAGSNANPTFNKNGIYIYKEGIWTSYGQYNWQLFDTIYDITIAQPLTAENKIILGGNMPGGGIVEMNVSDNSVIVPKVYRPNSTQKFRITNSTVDAANNVWLTDAYSSFPLICRKTDGNYKFFNNVFLNNTILTDVVEDDYGQIWISKNSSSGGLTVFNHNYTIDDISDDQYVNYSVGENNGNLPSNNILCLEKDHNGEIWLGTSQGIAVIRCAGSGIDRNCPAEQICIGRNDGTDFCDNLLEDQTVTVIKVDAANRKWIGTNNGIYLVSEDGETQIHYFNKDNSPLLGNEIRSIAIQPNTGDVFIGTNLGICSYRSTATETTSESGNAFVYPNPVQSNYQGIITIKNIPNNCNVKITDAVGNLVYETQATGGQATWDGKLINGGKAASGVYLVLCKGIDKKEKLATKFVFLH